MSIFQKQPYSGPKTHALYNSRNLLHGIPGKGGDCRGKVEHVGGAKEREGKKEMGMFRKNRGKNVCVECTFLCFFSLCRVGAIDDLSVWKDCKSV